MPERQIKTMDGELNAVLDGFFKGLLCEQLYLAWNALLQAENRKGTTLTMPIPDYMKDDVLGVLRKVRDAADIENDPAGDFEAIELVNFRYTTDTADVTCFFEARQKEDRSHSLQMNLTVQDARECYSAILSMAGLTEESPEIWEFSALLQDAQMIQINWLFIGQVH